MSYEAKHDFVPQSNKNESHANKSKYVIMVVGASGAGKSSLIGLFTSKCSGAATAKAGTSKSTIHEETVIGNRSWMDTIGVGMKDESGKCCDDKTLKDILRLAQVKHIHRLKIVWIVSGDLIREADAYEQQAKFIRSLSANGSSNANAWDSCLIVQKEGKLKPKLKAIIGIAQAAGSRIEYDNKKDLHSLGYTYMDQISKDNLDDYPTLEALYDDDDDDEYEPSLKKLKKFGFLTNVQIREEINARLSALPTLYLQFENERCSKCAVTGDRRYLHARCHVRQDKYHPKVNSAHLIHHPGYFHDEHAPLVGGMVGACGGVALFTAGLGLTIFTAGLAAPALAASAGAGVSAAFGAAGGAMAGKNSSTYGYTCCGKKKKGGAGCQTVYSCCNKVVGSEGCKTRCSSCKGEWGTAPGLLLKEIKSKKQNKK